MALCCKLLSEANKLPTGSMTIPGDSMAGLRFWITGLLLHVCYIINFLFLTKVCVLCIAEAAHAEML